MARNRESKSVPKVKLNRAEKKQLAAIMAQAQKKKGPQTAQQTIPYQRMWPDGICRVTDHYYTKTIQFFDINYQLAQNEDKEAIFEAWCDVLNYFSPDIRFQFSFVNTVASEAAFEQSVIIPPQGDGFDDIREARVAYPPLTTVGGVQQPLVKALWEALEERIKNGSREKRINRLIEPELIIRNSVK